MYLSQKVTVRDVRVANLPESIENQTTLDSFVLSGSDKTDKTTEEKKQGNPKQQMSLGSFFSKKAETPNQTSSDYVDSSVVDCTGLTVPPPPLKIPSYQTHHQTSYNSSFDTNSGETNVRLESKSAPLPQPPSTGDLSPATKAKIEANRLRALARRNQILAQKTSDTSYLVPPFASPSPIERFQTNNPVSLHNTTQSHCGNPQNSYISSSHQPSGHVFSTGSGNSVSVCQDAIDRASHLISASNPVKKVRSID